MGCALIGTLEMLAVTPLLPKGDTYTQVGRIRCTENFSLIVLVQSFIYAYCTSEINLQKSRGVTSIRYSGCAKKMEKNKKGGK